MTNSGAQPQEQKKSEMTTATRETFVFWDKFSGNPDNNAMMLNHNSDDLEEADRLEILSSLPNLKDLDLVDVGAGIGRFTTILAETARWVLSTDFIESFIQKNQERNAHLGNINYQVGDACNLKLDATSVDLVFTNWLMMYLKDAEVVEFLQKSLTWLRPNGYLHLRESCSEPSTGRKATSSMHSGDVNPTSYRFSSLYIQLLRTIRHRDADGKLYRFDVQWSCSVPTYIKRQNNWRQVHWLTRKVLADEGDECPSTQQLLELFSTTWQNEQRAWDAKLDGEKYAWSDKIFSNVLSSDLVPKNSTVFAFTPRHSSPYLHINAHLLAEKFTCNVWNTELKPFLYRTSLTKANNCKDQRVRFGWNETLASSISYWYGKQVSFDAVVATELLSSPVEEVKTLVSVLKPEAKLVLLEPVAAYDEEEIKQKLSACGLTVSSISDVSEEAAVAIAEYAKEHQLEVDSTQKYALVQAHF